MMLGTRDARALAIERAVMDRDHLRRSQVAYGAPAGHKEWLHFAVQDGDLGLLLNFSLVDDIRKRARHGAELARITCLVHDGRGFDGDIQECPIEQVVARGGELGIRMGRDGAWFEDGVYRLVARLRRRAIDIDLRLTPRAFPSEANNVMVEDGPCINWMLLPRLTASGVVLIDGRRYELRDAPAYHDHNWGTFRWGRNFTWEWGYALPASPDVPWTVVMVRLMDRGHNTDLMQGLFLWKDGRQVRVFRDDEIRIWHEGLLGPRAPFKLPRVMGLVSPGRVTDVPRRVVMEAKGRGDRATFVFDAQELAQVIIPNDDDSGVTIINEVFGSLSLEGEVQGEELSIAGDSVCEFLGA